MREETRKLLAADDELGCYEFPSSFDYGRLESAALQVNEAIRAQLNEETEFEGAVYHQDASFSIDIFLIKHRQAETRLPCIRFSNFGSLATVTYPELLPVDLAGGIIKILEAAGFSYIPEDELDVPYDGVMAGDPALPTWWIRYFDWI